MERGLPGGKMVNKSFTSGDETMPDKLVLKVNGIKIGMRKKFENGGFVAVNDVDLNGDWDTMGQRRLEYHMDKQNEYALYCNVESSAPNDQYDVFIEPVLKKGHDLKLFLDGMKRTYDEMISHDTQKKCYVKDFDWFKNSPSWREPGDYRISLKTGYLKKGTQFGTEPNWFGTDEFIVKLS